MKNSYRCVNYNFFKIKKNAKKLTHLQVKVEFSQFFERMKQFAKGNKHLGNLLSLDKQLR